MDIVEKPQQDRDLTLEVLPHPILTEIASYLLCEAHNDRTTGADTLLAVALTASKSSWDKLQYDDTTDIDKLLSPATKAVLSMHTDDWRERYEKICFNHTRMNLNTVNPNKYIKHKLDLDDIDLKAVLICIDARNNVKSLRLNECFDITGRGLEPLAGSSVIEKIDLSLVVLNYERCKFDMEQISLCEGIVLPILHSIIEGESPSLRLVQLPLKWRNGKSNELSQFMGEYDSHLERLELTCQRYKWNDEKGDVMKCLNECGMGMHHRGERYGIQTATCYKCLECFCTEEDCTENDNFAYCPHCQTYLCNDCSDVYHCSGSECQKSSCSMCCEVWLCQVCHEAYCNDCKGIPLCCVCYKSICNDCGPMKFCFSCRECFCDGCGGATQCKNCR